MVIGCLQLIDVIVICRVVNPRRTSHKIWRGFLYSVYCPGSDFELIPAVKIKTKNFVVNFRRSVIIAELWRPEVARRYNFLETFWVFGRTTLYVKIVKILFRKFLSRHRSTYCVQILSVKSCIAYLTKNNISPGCPAVVTNRIAPKICQA